MRNKLGSYLILGLAANALMFSTASQAAARWNTFDIKLNAAGKDIGVGIDTGKTANLDGDEQIFVSLGKGFETVKAADFRLKYTASPSITFGIDGTQVKSGNNFHFKGIKYGDNTHTISLYVNGKKTETYKILFTNLPVIQIAAADIQDITKKPGKFRLMSGEFQQDTGPIDIGIEIRGQTSQFFPKKSYGMKFGPAPKFSGNKLKLLDLRLTDDWILDASYRDPTFARNIIGHDIFREIHPKNVGVVGQTAIKGRLAEVILNGNYNGVYMLDEKVTPTMLGLKTGSFLYKADFSVDTDKTRSGGSVFFPTNSSGLRLIGSTSASKPSNFSQEFPEKMTAASIRPLQDFAKFVATSTPEQFIGDGITTGIETKIDLNSVADWWLEVRALQMTDNTTKNFFLAKPNARAKFFMVPWDMDASSGMFWSGATESPSTFFVPVKDNNLIKRLLETPDSPFPGILKARWKLHQAKGTFTKAKLLARFAAHNKKLIVGGAKARNTAVWPAKLSTIVKPAILVPNPKLATPAYIGAFYDTRLTAMNNYINNLK